MNTITKLAIAFGPVVAASLYVQPYRPVIVTGHSMMPTFRSGQLVVATKLNRSPRDGDVVLANVEGSLVIKRITMVAGDRFQEVKVLSDSDWQIVSTPGERRLVRKGLLPCRTRTVPDGRVFLSGDNPMMSYDSREFGLVSTAAIRGLIVSRP